MRKSEIDDLLSTMLESHDNVSDLNVTCDRPLQVEAAGELVPVPTSPSIESLTPFQAEIFALNLVNNDRRLTEHLLRQGSCDSSYFLPGKARFRVNIFSQRGNYSVVLRKLETRIPTIEDLKLPEAFRKMPACERGSAAGSAWRSGTCCWPGCSNARPSRTRPPPCPGTWRLRPVRGPAPPARTSARSASSCP